MLQKKYFDPLWLLLRIWFGSLLIYNSLHPDHSNALYLLFKLFGDAMDEDFRDLMPRIAREIEFISGLIILMGLFTKKVNAFLAIFILTALISSKIGWINFDNGNKALTYIFFWFSCLFIFFGPGKWSLDYIFFKKKGTKELRKSVTNVYGRVEQNP